MINKLKSFVKHPLFAGSFIMIFGNLGINAINYLYHLLMGRLLGPVDYGILASLFSILYIVGIIPQSTSFAITKFISTARNASEVKSIYKIINRFVFIFALIAAVTVAILSPLIVNFLRIGNSWLVLLIAPELFIMLITLVNQATSQGLLKFSGVVIPNLVSSVGKILVGIGLVILGFNVLGAMYGVLLGAILSYFSSRPYIKAVLREKTEKSDFKIKHFLKYALPVLVQALAFTSLFTTDVILVKHFLSSFDAGLYAALSTLGKIIYFASSPITATMFPIVSNKKAKGENYKKVFYLAFGATLIVSSGVVMLYYLFPKIAIGVLYGSQYLKAAPELFLMALFMLFYSLDYIIINFLLSIGKTKIIALPLTISLFQIIGIWFWHSNMSQVIKVSLYLTILLFVGLMVYLGYNRIKKKGNRYEKKAAFVGYNSSV